MLNKIMRNNPKFVTKYPAAAIQGTTGVNLSPSVAPSLSPTPTQIPTFLPAPPGTWQTAVIVLGAVLGAGAVVLVLALFFRRHARLPQPLSADNGVDNDDTIVGSSPAAAGTGAAAAFHAVALHNITHAQARQQREEAYERKLSDHRAKVRQATV